MQLRKTMSMKAILGIMLATCILINSNGDVFFVKENTSDTAKPKATVVMVKTAICIVRCFS